MIATRILIARLADRLSRSPLTLRLCTVAVREAVADGLAPRKGSPAMARAVLAAAAAQAQKRAARSRLASPPLPLPLPDRLAAYKRAKAERVCAAVRAARKGLYRIASYSGKYAPQSGHTTEVRVGTPGVNGESWKVLGRKYAATASRHVYTVARDWIETVQDRGLAKLDGLFTLSASPVQGVGPELYEALWVEQGRGCTLNQERGYIAYDRPSGRAYHAGTARAALDGLARKLGLKPTRRKGTVDLDRLVRRHGDLPVYWSDREGIACESGTRSWCHAVGCPVEGCTVADVVAGYRLRPMPEALQVVRRVVRSGRRPREAELPTASALELDGRVVFDSEGGFRVVRD